MDPEVKKWQCMMCNYVYDPAVGDPTQEIPPATSFESLPEEWVCPECGASKENFEMLLEL